MRWTRLAATPLLAALVLAPAAPARAGGGGCAIPHTTAEGVVVEMRDVCFTPTIVRIDRGDTVTWVNRDPVPHVIAGTSGAWGEYGKMREGDTTGFRFGQDGVFPYACYLHPSMVGAVFVGDGIGKTTLRRLDVTHVEVPLTPVADTESATVEVAGGNPPPELLGDRMPFWPVAGLALAVAAAFLFLAFRRVDGRRGGDDAP